jgi:hypothetical protein
MRNRLSPERSAVVQGHINKITESHNSHNKSQIQNSISNAQSDIKRGTLEWSYLMATLSRLRGVELPDDILPSLQLKADQPNAQNILNRFQAAAKFAGERHPQYVNKLKSLSKHVESKVKAASKETPSQKIVAELLRSDLTPVQERDMLAFFETKDGASDALLNDVLNAHPIAAKLLGDRLQVFFRDFVSYSENYKEGAETLFPDISTDPLFEKGWKKDPHFESPTPNHPPFNSPIEEVYQWKLERLAQLFNFDLSTPLGLSQFEILTHSYDLSPGEPTLERTHSYPSFYHTYEELPIIKYDGYDPFEEEHVSRALDKTAETDVQGIVKRLPATQKAK